jgi:phage-related protein (TIGR01555 family)
MVLATNMGAVMSGKPGKDFFTRLRLFNNTRDNRGVMAIDKDTEELTNVSTPLGTLDKLLAQSQEQIASVAGIPLVVLLGVTPAGLNASSDGEVRTFYATIKAYQERVLRQPLEFMIECIQYDLFGDVDDDAAVFEFIDLWEMDEKDKALVRKSDAELDGVYIDKGVVSADETRLRIVQDQDSPYFGLDLSAPAPEPPDPTGGAGVDDTGDEGDDDAPPADDPKD